MTIETLIAAYTAWLLAWMAPLWLLSFLYRSLKRTIGWSEPSAAALPARPERLPSIHLTAA